MSPEEIYEKLEVTNVLASGVKKDILFQRCSAMTGDGVWDGIEQLSTVLHRIKMTPSDKPELEIAE